MPDSFSHIGELAALGTAVCWAGSALSFEAGGKRIGSLSVNLIRLVIALLFLTGANFLLRGQALPIDASAHAWLWLGLSGLIGFLFGDLCLFRAFVLLGSRLSVLIMSLVPPLTALLGWIVLGETIALLDGLAIALTVLGVATAVGERPGSRPYPPGHDTESHGADDPGHGPGSKPAEPTLLGVLLAVGGALGQAGGLVVSKYGMGSYNALAATQIRIIAGVVGFAALFFAIGWWPRLWAARRQLGGLGFTAMGSFFGPFVGVSLSLYAVQHTSAGVAASIMATTPILIIPLVALIHGERITIRGVLGATMALAGVTLLFS